MKKLLLLTLIVCVGVAQGQKDSPRTSEEKKLEKSRDVHFVVNTIVNWGSVNTPSSAHMELRPIGKQKAQDKEYFLYEVLTSGLAADQSYGLFYWPINLSEPRVVYPEVFIVPAGGLCATKDACHDGNGPYVQLGISSAKAEPHRYALVSKDGKQEATAKVMPDPIVASDHDCTVEVIRGTPLFEMAIIRGQGFKPKKEIPYHSNSEGEKRDGSAQTGPDGVFTLVMAPFVKGKDKGTDTITFKTADCQVTVSYKWGTIED